MIWFRFYDEVLDDPKVQRLPAPLFRHWVNLLCLANKSGARGTVPDLATVAFRLRTSEAKAAEVLRDLTAAGLLDGGETLRPHNWEGRQRNSDNVAERVRKHRREQAEPDAGNGSVTLQVTGCNALARATDTETEKETDTETEKEAEREGEADAGETPASAPPAVAAESPFSLFEALCEETAQDATALDRGERAKQLAVAKRLQAAGLTSADIRRMAHWLQSADWVRGGYDLFLVEKQLAKWKLAGRPEVAARSNGRARPARGEASLAVVPEAAPGHRAATTPLPEGWWPSEEQMAAARRFGLTAAQVETLTGEFVAHATATGKTSLDWATAWQTRLRLVAQQGVAS